MKVVKHKLSGLHDGKLNQLQSKSTNAEQNILTTTVSGPIDYASVKAVAQVRARCFDELNVTKIVSIVIVQGSMRVTPDALDLFSQVINNFKTQSEKTLFIAYVAEPNIEDRTVTCNLIQAILDKNDVGWQVFEKLEDAQAWAKAMVNGNSGDAEHDRSINAN